MAEPITRVEIDHIKDDIIDLKNSDKERATALTQLRGNHIETKIYMRQIKEDQKKTNDGQVKIIDGLEDIKKKRAKNQDKLTWAIILFIVSWVLGNVLSYLDFINR